MGRLRPIGRGKVRDLYLAPSDGGEDGDSDGRLVIVASDRISAFDVVMRTAIEGKGRLLTEMSRRWFEFVEARGLARTHVVGWEVDAAGWGLTVEEAGWLRGRVCVCERARVVPVECVVRGYLDGSGWKEYRESGAVCGVGLPSGLERGSRLPRPIFTPATKAEAGAHDENISFERACAIAGRAVMERSREASLAIYEAGAAYAEERGIILADTKFEFGFAAGAAADESDAERPMLVDEVLTPDSSRYWRASSWAPGGAQAGFDKQYLRDYLQGLVDRGEWDKTADAEGLGPELPAEVVDGVRERYEEALRSLWG